MRHSRKGSRGKLDICRREFGVNCQLSAKPQLIYDGICNLCTSAVRFLSTLDRRGSLHYVPSQQLSSKIRAKYGLTEGALQGQMHLIMTDDSLASGAFATARVVELLTPFHAAARLLRTPPARLVYNWIARRRYGLFGCRDTCYVPHSRARS